MSNFVIHIGAPRTGTTTLQKHIFMKARETYVICKEAFQAGVTNKTNLGVSTFSIQDFLGGTNKQEIILETKSNNKKLLDIILSLTQANACFNDQKLQTCLRDLLETIYLKSREQNVLISSERLIESSASLDGNSFHLKGSEQEFSIFTLLNNFPLKFTPQVVVCLREPVDYLVSKYFRTVIQRDRKNLRYLTPEEYISKQIILENSLAGSSALAPAIHSEFIKQLTKILVPSKVR